MRAMLHSREDAFPISLFNRCMKNCSPVCIVDLTSAVRFFFQRRYTTRVRQEWIWEQQKVKSGSFLRTLNVKRLLRKFPFCTHHFSICVGGGGTFCKWINRYVFKTLFRLNGERYSVLLFDGSFVFCVVLCSHSCFSAADNG